MCTAKQQLDLIDFLESFLPAIDSRIPTEINQGGCGIFAKHLLLNLQTLGLDEDFKIFFISDKEEYKDLEYTLKNNKIKKSNQHVGVKHCLVRINDYIFVDSKGVELSPTLSAKSTKEIISGEISLEVLQTLIENKDSWNTIFDRGCETAIARELGRMKEVFEDFQKTGVFSMTIAESVRLTNHTIKERDKQRGSSIFDFLH